ncbi:MAG: SDR family NAD(P)-dependent oxidoreductase [Pseudonocardia sp.]|nr:SDR family NAD(P)-dependent oxidoreductase [Pseudonocardia sp.]
MTNPNFDGHIAIVGLDCRVPGARDHHELWENLLRGHEAIADIDDERMRAAGVPGAAFEDPRYVRRGAVVEDADLFDASFFYLSTRDAERMDPQLRLFLQSSWSALERSGHDSEQYTGRIGMFAGSLASTYLLHNVLTGAAGFGGDLNRLRGDMATLMSNDPNYLATRVSYHLNLTGPSITVQTACSTSLVAVHLAVQSLLGGECDLAMAGGVALRFPQEAGYREDGDGIASATGTVRPFDADADGTLFGNGVGVVVLKRLTDAVAEGDTVLAVIRGSAVGNDGADRVGYTAPGITGQVAVLTEALAAADVDPATVSYLETHGTGTRMGDPIELSAITEAYQPYEGGPLTLGSVKANLGHLSTAAGVIGLIKCTLMLHHRTLVPTPHFQRWNPECAVEGTRFRLGVATEPWVDDSGPLRCSVTSTGMGGTTAHVVMEEAPARAAVDVPPRPVALLLLSAKSPTALDAARTALADHLAGGDVALEDVAYTLAIGRRTFDYRAALVVADRDEAVTALRTGSMLQDSGAPQNPPVVFLFPGQGTQYPAMSKGWYDHLPVFRSTMDDCARLLVPELGLDLREVLYGSSTDHDLNNTRITQPALFCVEYSLARQWMSWSVQPAAMIGHSVGEYVAACLAGVMDLPDALRVIAERGRLVETLPGGVMVAVMLSQEELTPYLSENVSLAAVNEPSVCTVAGSPVAIAELTSKLSSDGVAHRKVTTSHAFHSAMMDPAMEPLTALLRTVPLRRPRIPYLSNRTGTWIRDDEATSPEYWGAHLREPVRFSDSLSTVLGGEKHVFLEVGPGQTLSTFARRHPDRETGVLVLPSAPRQRDGVAELNAVVAGVGRLWAAGHTVDWTGYYPDGGHRVPLPTYPFEGTRYWIEPGSSALSGLARSGPVTKLPLDDWFTAPVWRPAVGTLDAAPGPLTDRVLLFADPDGNAARLAGLAFAGEVITVRAGAAYGRDGDTFVVRPEAEEDYASLIGALLTEDRFPNRVVHAWSTAALSGERSIDRFERAQREGLYSVIGLVKAVSAHGVTQPWRLDLVTAGAFAVTPSESEPLAERVAMSVAAKVVGQEHGNIGARHFDLPVAVDYSSLRTLATELATARRSEVATTLRAGTRWVVDLEAVRADWNQEASSRLKDGGVYLITGGLGEIGSTVAGWLRRTCGARLALLTRDALPPRETWDQVTVDDGETALRIARLRALEQAGAEILLLAADVADEPSMRAAVDETVDRFGQLNGVVHAAGLPSEQWDRAVTAASVEQCGWHFVPKAHGQIVLERVLADRPVDFVLLMSSLAGVLGGLRLLGYGAANHFMDAAAERANRGLTRTVWISAGWDVWQHHQDEKRALSAIGRSMDDKAIQPEEGLEAIRRLLSLRDVSHVAVSTWPMSNRLDQWVRDLRLTELSSAAERLALLDDSGADLEAQVLRLVREALGEPDLPEDADIFEHGGDSLLIVRLLSDLRDQLDAEVPLADVLSEPTPQALAALIQARRADGEAADGTDATVDALAAELAALPPDDLERLLVEQEN